MSELPLLRREVLLVLRTRRHLERDALDHLEPRIERDELVRVVREDPRFAHAEVEQDLDTDAVLALIRLEAELLVRLDGVEPLILERVRPELVHEADAATLLPQVEQHATAFLRDAVEGGVELVAAIAAERPERVASEALVVDAYEDRPAIEPSGFVTSQMTPTGSSPASRHRSTAASVWPARTRTPPSSERSGITC